MYFLTKFAHTGYLDKKFLPKNDSKEGNFKNKTMKIETEECFVNPHLTLISPNVDPVLYCFPHFHPFDPKQLPNRHQLCNTPA